MLLDFALIGKNSFDTLAAIQNVQRERRQADAVPIVIFATRLDEDVKKLIEGESAIKGYLIPPFTADELLDTVEEALKSA